MTIKSNWIFQGSMQRTLVSLLLVIFVPLLLLQLGIYYTWFEVQRKHVMEDNLDMARAIARTVGSVVRDVTAHELALGSVLLLSEPNSPRMEKLLKISADEDKTISSFNWVLPDGHIAITSDPNKVVATINDRPYFQQILAGKNAVVSDFLPQEELSGLPAITISRGIRDNHNNLQGVVVGVVTAEEFNDLIPPLQSSKISSILVFDRRGTLIYRWPEVALTLSRRNAWLNSDRALRSAIAGSEGNGSFVSPVDNQKEYVARVPVDNTGLIVGVARARSEIILPIARNILFNFAIVLVIMATSLLFAGMIGRKILTSILHLREHARAIGQGNLEHRPDVGEIMELKELANEFNQMALQLKDRNIRIEQAMIALKHSNEDLEQFAYTASHDLQEPLRAVSGFVELLRLRLQDKIDSKATEYMDFAVNGVTRMQELISGLLEYAHIDTRGKSPQPTDSRTALDRAILNLQASIKDSGAKITSDGLPTVSVDPLQLAQLFQNLIGNAIKFRSDLAPEIHVSAARQGSAWQFAVSDNGLGIEPQYYQKIFLIFQRLHTPKKTPGTGIGLALCKKIVERHGGKIWVESEPGHGSTFYFTVPDIGEA